MILAAGPAFAPLKWNMGKNNMAGYKARLLFVPEEAAITVPTVPDPEKATDNTELITAAGSFTFAEGGSIKQPIYLYSTDGEVEYKAEPQGEADGISFKQTLGFSSLVILLECTHSTPWSKTPVGIISLKIQKVTK